jgi:hypothetical protein
MAMDVWRRDDIRYALRAAVTAHENLLADPQDPVVIAYNLGYYKAIRVIGAAFGINIRFPEVDANVLPPALVDFTAG